MADAFLFISIIFKFASSDLPEKEVDEVKEGDENGEADPPSVKDPWHHFLGHGNNLTANWKTV